MYPNRPPREYENYSPALEDIRVRKLTPKECWRLMGFDDEDIDKCIGAGLSNTQLYKQAGNSIVVDVLEGIFTQLYKAVPTIFDGMRVLSLFSGIGAFEKALDRVYGKVDSLGEN